MATNHIDQPATVAACNLVTLGNSVYYGARSTFKKQLGGVAQKLLLRTRGIYGYYQVTMKDFALKSCNDVSRPTMNNDVLKSIQLRPPMV